MDADGDEHPPIFQEPDNHVIKNAINLPAQTFHQTLSGIYSVLSE
jgi:hypothetical protein